MFRIRMLVVSMLFSVFCFPLVSQAQLDEAAMMATAKGHYQEGGYYYASTWLERILRNWPGTAQREEILLMMAKSYAATGREDKAARTVKTLLKDYPQAGGKLDQDILKLVQEPEAAIREVPALQAVEAAAPAPVTSPALQQEQLPEVAALSAGGGKEPVAAVAPVLAKPAAPARAVPDAASQSASVAPDAQVAEQVPNEVKAPSPAETPLAPEALNPAAVAEAATPAVSEPAKPVVAVVATPAPAPSNPAALSVDTLKAAETETACRDNSATAPGTYAIELGEYIGKNALARGKRAVKKAGLMPVVGMGRQKAEVMLRILVGEFTDEGAAKKVLNKLRKAGAEQFMLKDKEGTFRIYAGSYFEHQAALDEQKRLLVKGFPSELKEATVPVLTYVINAGCFETEEAARGKLAELERLGMKGKVRR